MNCSKSSAAQQAATPLVARKLKKKSVTATAVAPAPFPIGKAAKKA